MKNVKLLLVTVALMVVGLFEVDGKRREPASRLAAAAGGHSGNAAAAAGRGSSVGVGGDGRGGGEGRGGAAPLSISRGNGRSAIWKLDDLERVRARTDVSTERGAASAWSLREVAATLLDRGDRISALSNAQGQTLLVSAADWADETRLPLLRVNHRGLWKFDWVDAATRAPRAGGMRDVSGLTVSP
ncbi:MAG: hypothetical protein JWM53_5794 [bacterium]|nr:hypothetical protein [bacterium]